MKRATTFIAAAVCVALLTASAAYARSYTNDSRDEHRSGLELLKEARELMSKLCKEHLPCGNVGPEVQEDERRIIRNLDDLIEMILDLDAEPLDDGENDEDNRADSKAPEQTKPDNDGNTPGGPEPAPSADPDERGNPDGNHDGGGQPPPHRSDTWDPLLPDREYDDTPMPGGTETVPGYEELLRRFREAILKEGARLPK